MRLFWFTGRGLEIRVIRDWVTVGGEWVIFLDVVEVIVTGCIVF